MKILILVFSMLYISAKAEVQNAQCTGDATKCSKEHTEDSEHGHQHEEEEGHSDEQAHGDDEHKHAKEEEHHDEEKGHGEHEESDQVGPNKGILEANEKNGFKLSPEATKNFKMKFQTFSGGPLVLPLDSILQTTNEKNIYRMRDGFIKRVDITVIAKSKSELTFTSSELKSGDQIVLSGLGYLRMAELAAFGGAPEGHSH